MRGRPLLLTELVDHFLTVKRMSGRTEATLVDYERGLARLVRHLAAHGVHYVDDVRDQHMVEWFAGLRQARGVGRNGTGRYAPLTIRGYVSIVCLFFGWLEESGVLLENPARSLSTRGVRDDPASRLKIPTEDEVRSLLDRIPRSTPVQIRDWAVLELVYSSGLRVAEVRRLDLWNVDLVEHVVWVRQGKGRKDRAVPVGPLACAAVEHWLCQGRPQMMKRRSERALFVSPSGRRMGKHVLYHRLEILRRELRFRRLRLHDFRHAAALHMLRHGADLRHIQEFLGHSQLITTGLYTQLVVDDLKQIHARCHPREKHKDRA